ncbi:hypothetical protein [Actinomadura livida]|uniref:DUF5709 domain-containing protein n=1 Tax=Actinomadura livida TaxID=79909 RepID=A0A7W7IAL7_9ACTN|nr:MULTISPECIES: hypothetical protein [Actinomadura]MBB4773475.1 hypothetical protein [Actinomadura catellatispora]GGU08500.1 hypothetical protein GCM10010208_36140 [Actinomadura livida]
MSETDDLDPAVAGPGGDGEADEADEADAAEQRAAIGDEEGPLEWSAQVPDDVNEADAVEQRYEVPLDEDDYR